MDRALYQRTLSLRTNVDQESSRPPSSIYDSRYAALDTQRLPYPVATSVSCGAPVHELAVSFFFLFCFIFMQRRCTTIRENTVGRYRSRYRRDRFCIATHDVEETRILQGRKERERGRESCNEASEETVAHKSVVTTLFRSFFSMGWGRGRSSPIVTAKGGKNCPIFHSQDVEVRVRSRASRRGIEKKIRVETFDRALWGDIVRTMHIRVSLNDQRKLQGRLEDQPEFTASMTLASGFRRRQSDATPCAITSC